MREKRKDENFKETEMASITQRKLDEYEEAE